MVEEVNVSGRRGHCRQSSICLQELTELLWAHCDSPVDGVGEFVISCFKSLLSTTNRHVRQSVPLHQQLLDKLLPMPWNVKAKMKLLTVVIPWTNIEQVSLYALTCSNRWICMF